LGAGDGQAAAPGGSSGCSAAAVGWGFAAVPAVWAMMVPVVPGDGRVACQHCPARIQFTGAPELTWIDPDGDRSGFWWCVPATDVRAAIWHQPMPRVRADR
jgi:hypothetical protein